MIKNKNKFKWGGTHPFFLHPFLSYFTPADLKEKVILDVGCGKGLNGYLIRVTRDVEGSTLIGLDINKEYLSFCRTFNTYTKLVEQKLPKLPFKDKSVDLLICTEVIEHLKKKDGERLLKEIDRVCRGRAIVSTPNILFDTLPNELEDAHHSIWGKDNFEKFGYKVHGLGFRTSITVDDPLLRLKQALYYFFAPISYFFPQIGGVLLCVKNY